MTGLLSLLQQILVANHTKLQLALVVITVLANSVSSNGAPPRSSRDLLKKETVSLHTSWLGIDVFLYYYMLEFGPEYNPPAGYLWATKSLQIHCLWPTQYFENNIELKVNILKIKYFTQKSHICNFKKH